jgi:hypothetical protein
MLADKAIDTKTQFFRRYITASYINNENEKGENVGNEKATCQKAEMDNLEMCFLSPWHFLKGKKRGKRRDISTRACFSSLSATHSSFFFAI